jgi:hypothetical protein
MFPFLTEELIYKLQELLILYIKNQALYLIKLNLNLNLIKFNLINVLY